MVYYVDRNVLKRMVQLRHLSEEEVIRSCTSEVEARKIFAGGPTRARFTLNEICRTIKAMPYDFCKRKDEDTDNSDDIEEIMEAYQQPLDSDPEHYTWSPWAACSKWTSDKS